MLVVCLSETIVVFLFTIIMINKLCILERAMYRPLCPVRKLGKPKFLNLQWNGYNEWPVPDKHDDIIALMDLHNGHVDLIKEIQTALIKRAKLWDHEPALVYLYTIEMDRVSKVDLLWDWNPSLGPIHTGDWESPQRAVCFLSILCWLAKVVTIHRKI